MKKLILTSAFLIASFATPVFAQDCASIIKEFDSAVEQSKATPDAKTKAIDLRMKGEKQLADGDENSCVATLATALKTLDN